MTVLSFGELLVDMVSPSPDASLAETSSFVKAPGGAPANVAVGLQRLGVPARFVGQVGDDPFGHWLHGILAQEALDVRHLRLTPKARTTIAFVATRRDGKKDICFYRNPGADAELRTADLRADVLDGVNLFHCGSVSLSLEPCRSTQFELAKRAHDAGILVSFDPNWRPSLWDDHEEGHRVIWAMMPLSDVVKVADEEWELVTGTTDFAEGAAKIRAEGPQLVIMTRGEDGASYDAAGAHGEVPGYAVDAISTLGAGDAFVAGVLAELLRAPSLESVLNDAELTRILRFANACGALATLQPGAIPALPTRAGVETFLGRP